jgi:PAS domain S-box-containing protein
MTARRQRRPSDFEYHAAAWQYARDALLWTDAETGHVLDANPQAESLFGRPREELVGLSFTDLHPRDLRDEARQGFALHADGTTDPIELDVERADGRRVPVEIRAQLVLSNGKRMLLGTFRDLGRLQAVRFENARRAAALAAIHQATMAAMQAESDRDLMTAFCDGIIAEGAYGAAFVGLANDDADRTITILAARGTSRGYLEETPLAWADAPLGAGPTGRAIRLATTQIVNRVRGDKVFEPWADRLRHFEVEAMLSVPLIESGRAFGALTIYAKEADSFSDVERRLFEDLSRQLVLGIRMRREHHEYSLQVIENIRKEAQVRRALEQTVGAVSTTIEQRDPYTAGHSRAVAELSERIATRLGISREQIHGIYLAGLVHDVGKIRIPAEILSKPGKLSAIEYQLLQTHAETGYEILRGVDFPWPIPETTFQHHERLDGSGYPRGLRADEIILEARILAVADIVDSMSTHRPYRAALPREVVVAELQHQRGRMLDADAVDSALQELPI